VISTFDRKRKARFEKDAKIPFNAKDRRATHSTSRRKT